MDYSYSPYGSSLPSIQSRTSIQSLPSKGRRSCLTITYDKSPRNEYGAVISSYFPRMQAEAKKKGAAASTGFGYIRSARNVSTALSAVRDYQSYGHGYGEGCCTCTPEPSPLQGKVALYSQQSEHGKRVGNTITAGMPTFYHTTTFFNSPSRHSKTSPPLSFSSFLSSSSPTLKPLPAAFRAASPAISLTRRARVVTSSATKSSSTSTSTLGDTSVSSEEKIYLVFRDEATLTNFLAKISEDGLVMTEIASHPRADTLDEASGKKGKVWVFVPSEKMYEKCQTGEPDGRIQETLPGYYGPVYAIISITDVFMIATMPLTIALILQILVEKHAQILVEKQLCNAQVSLLPVDNHETKGKMVPMINLTSVKYGLIGQLNQHPMSSVGEPLVSSVAEPLIRATDYVGKWGQVSPVAAVIFAASVILSKILG